MSDSTAFIDSTGFVDATGIIVIDATANLNAAITNSLIEDFSSLMGPISNKCTALSGQLNKIKTQISNITNASPVSLINTAMRDGLDGAYKSTSWSLENDTSEKINAKLNKCSFFKDNAAQNPKYSDPGKMLGSLGSGASTQATDVVDGVVTAIKQQYGFDLNELTIGKLLADIANTGRTPFDVVNSALTDLGEITDVIEYGKTAVSQIETPLSQASKDLANIDKLINCADAIGGPDYSEQIDDMIAETNCYYDRLGVFSDPSEARFGEFDFDTYLDSVSTATPQIKSNIKKGVNLYSKAKNNSEGALQKAAESTLSSQSSVGAKPADSMASKKKYVDDQSKTVFTIPAENGKPARKEEIPPPQPLPIPETQSGTPPEPEPPKVPVSKYLTTSLFEVRTDASLYNTYDPNNAQENVYKSLVYDTISKFKVPEPSSSPSMEMKIYLTYLALDIKYGPSGYRYLKGVAQVYITFRTSGTNVISSPLPPQSIEFSSDNIKKDEFDNLGDEFKASTVINGVKTAIRNVARSAFSQESFEYLFKDL